MELAKFETIVNRINENGLYGKDANEYLELIVEFVGPVSGDELSQFVENVRDPKRENCHNCVNRVNHENKLILIALFSLAEFHYPRACRAANGWCQDAFNPLKTSPASWESADAMARGLAHSLIAARLRSPKL